MHNTPPGGEGRGEGGGARAPFAFSCLLEEEEEEANKENRQEVSERRESHKQACCLKFARSVVMCPTGALTAAAPSALAA